jgi:DNA-binding MltR family transcriptional regulator
MHNRTLIMASTDSNVPLTREQIEKVQAEMQTMVDALAGQMPSEAGQRMKEVIEFRASISNETDRGAVLMSAGYLDDKLKELIERRLVQDKKILRRVFDFTGALGIFSSRIDFVYLLGIIPKNAQRDLHTVRLIRNEFAHYASPLSYADEKVSDLCERLVFHGVKDVAGPGSKFRRTVMGLLSYITLAFEKVSPLDAEQDYEIPDITDAYRVVSKVFTEITGAEYPIRHHHE